KSQVEERYYINGKKANWKNSAEQGEKLLSGNAFYISMNGAPEEAGLLAQALLMAPGGKLSLLPDGEAQIEKAGELKIEANGQTRTVIQYSISGLDFIPISIWLDQDRRFFAIASNWFSVVREGWEPSI